MAADEQVHGDQERADDPTMPMSIRISVPLIDCSPGTLPPAFHECG
jgi:hypothetical protein